MNSKTFLKITLLLTSMMTMMAGAVVAPSLPQIKQVFIKVENVEILTRLVITLPALFIAFFRPLSEEFLTEWEGRIFCFFPFCFTESVEHLVFF